MQLSFPTLIRSEVKSSFLELAMRSRRLGSHALRPISGGRYEREIDGRTVPTERVLIVTARRILLEAEEERVQRHVEKPGSEPARKK